MKIPRAPHRWSVTPKQAVEIQQRLSSRVITSAQSKQIRFVAGVDAAFPRDTGRCLAGVVIWDIRDRQVIEQHTVSREVSFPYVPGLLSFREAPAVLAAIAKLKHVPDAIMLDGQGLAHPRRFGIACHVGVIINTVVVGCAKSRLVGEHKEPATRRGSKAVVSHRGERIGTVLRTQTGVRPVFVSVGHNIDLPTAERLVLACATRYRLPEPTRLADKLVSKKSKKLALERAD
ncbi:MAG: deoxyribonuclease V [Gammaproteobacteria bacterium]|nr:deoxyribonuclease V [Gammaproteobacteria bacterium]